MSINLQAQHPWNEVTCAIRFKVLDCFGDLFIHVSCPWKKAWIMMDPNVLMLHACHNLHGNLIQVHLALCQKKWIRDTQSVAKMDCTTSLFCRCLSISLNKKTSKTAEHHIYLHHSPINQKWSKSILVTRYLMWMWTYPVNAAEKLDVLSLSMPHEFDQHLLHKQFLLIDCLVALENHVWEVPRAFHWTLSHV